MKITALLATLPLALGVAACQTTNPTPTPIVQLLPENVQALIVKSCGLVISTADVQRLITTFRPELETIFSFIQGICGTAVTNGRTASGSGRIYATFRGVTFSAKRK